MDALSARRLAKFGIRRSAYDGANKRRFCMFVRGAFNGEDVERRFEFDSKQERDEAVRRELQKQGATA